MAGNILIVDDTPAVLKLLRDILVAEGYLVRPFNNGELALRSIAKELPELIILDVRMPAMDGFEVCRRVKAENRLKDIPVIFISAATDTEDKLRAFQAGGVDYITKPFQKEEVAARVHTHLALHRSRLKLMQTEEALRKSEQSLKIAQAVAGLGHWEMNMVTGEVVWSDKVYRILGLEPRRIEPSHETFLRAVHPDDRDRVAREISQTQEGSEFDIEYRIVLPDGRERVVHGRGVLVTAVTPEGNLEKANGVSCVTGMVGVVQDITERKELEWKLQYEARTDALTGCANRRYFLELAHQEFQRARRYGADLSVLMLDLDFFKKINDVYGHNAGDLTLQKLAQIGRDTLRTDDKMGRLGGEEFGVLLIETGRDRALEVAERLRGAIADTEVPLPDGPPLHFTASIGVATMGEQDGDFETILKRADHALYEAKNSGRNRVA